MSSPKLSHKMVLGIKTETTQGTAATLTATDFMLVEALDIKPIPELLKREPKRSTIDTLPHVMGTKYVQVTFRTEVKGSGTAGTAYAPFSAAIQACGFTETVVAATSVTYAPTSAPASSSFFGPGKSCTIQCFMDGVKHVVKGALGDFKLTLAAGKLGYWEFTFSGEYATPTDASFPTQTYLAQIPEILQSANFSMLGFAGVIANFEYMLKNTVTPREDANSPNALLGFIITNRAPEGSCDPEVAAVADHAFWDKVMTGAQGTIGITVGATAGNIVTFTFPGAQYLDASYQDRKGLLTYKVPLQFNQNTGDDHVSIALT